MRPLNDRRKERIYHNRWGDPRIKKWYEGSVYLASSLGFSSLGISTHLILPGMLWHSMLIFLMGWIFFGVVLGICFSRYYFSKRLYKYGMPLKQLGFPKEEV